MDEINIHKYTNKLVNKLVKKLVLVCLYICICIYENQPTIYNKVNNNSTAVIYFI